MAALRALKLSLTEACNLRCHYCYQRRRRRTTMTRPTLRAALELAARLGNGQTDLVLSGGEPLLAEELVTMALDRHPRGRTRLITNGTLLHPALLDRLNESQAQLQISADGVAEAQAGRGPDTWEVLDRWLPAIRTGHPDLWARRFTLAMTVTPRNVDHLSSSVTWALAHDVRRLEISLACGLTRDWGRSACTVLTGEMQRVLALSRDHRRLANGIPVTYLQPQPLAGRPANAPCAAPDVGALAVAADGGVHGCGVLADVARWHPSPVVQHAAAILNLGQVDDPDLPARWQRHLSHPSRMLPPPHARASGERRCVDCRRREQCVICPLAGPEPNHAPDAHCLFERLAHRGRRVMAETDPLAASLIGMGTQPEVAAALAKLVARAHHF